ncbi:saccharopine dehydrogenase C-terminal domain-containing protein [Nemorincola caseinilytica]|uniref:Saccharopine dehydrogenase C-terminal domain-containing protein n=1 Tax=Nemorincola caseinilytica TaxID=2054315 RepID=A0ABP8NNI6_9BACT
MKQTILVAGAGRSSIYLIEYLLENALRKKWHVIVADGDKDAIMRKLNKHPCGEAAAIDITNDEQRQSLVQRADIVLSLMPPHLHILLAHDCLKFNKNLITSSYISDEMKAMDEAVKKAGLVFMCEMGLDPGIDHMTASHIIHSVRKVAGRITAFRSYCGGLVAPSSDDNPWHYKFSWNPRNVVMAGMGGAKYLSNGKVTEVPYEHMFENNKKIKVPGLGSLAYYPNRDSVKYLDILDVQGINTFLRATLRYPAFCKGWQAIIKLGLTDLEDTMDTTGLTYAGWIRKKTDCRPKTDILKHVATILGIEESDKVMGMLLWLGIFEDNAIGDSKMSSADVLYTLLQEKWQMSPKDKDMVVMQHEIEYEHKGKLITLTSSMVLEGDGGEHTAMAKTVGLPMGILASLMLRKKVTPPVGVHMPVMPVVYKPVLKELEQHGIIFHDVVNG